MRVTRPVRTTSVFVLSGVALLAAGLIGVAPAAAAVTAGISITVSDVDGNAGDDPANPAEPGGTSVGLAIVVANTGTDNLDDVSLLFGAAPGSGAASITGLNCTFPDSSNGSTWAGPFLPGTSFGCVATTTVPTVAPELGLLAVVTATGATTDTDVTDSNPYYAGPPGLATTPPAEAPGTTASAIAASTSAAAAGTSAASTSAAAVGINTGSTGPSNGNNALIWLGSGLMLAVLAAFGWRATRIRLRVADGPRH